MNLTDPQLIEAMRDLPLRLRRAFEMQAAGASAEEIGQALHVSRSTAWRFVSQARQRLLSKLKATARAGTYKRNGGPNLTRERNHTRG
jgi:DNA-directed RNA polymerase specialized sigma24 family protein